MTANPTGRVHSHAIWGGYIRVEKCHITFPVEHVSKWQNLQRDFKVESIQWPPSEQGLANGRWACRVLVIRLLDSGELGMLVRASGRLKLVINLGVYSCQEYVLGSSIQKPDSPTGKYSCQEYWVVVPDSATGKYITLQCTLYSSNCK